MYSVLRNPHYSVFMFVFFFFFFFFFFSFFLFFCPFRRSENTSCSSVDIVLQSIPEISKDVCLVFPAHHASSYFCLGVDLDNF